MRAIKREIIPLYICFCSTHEKEGLDYHFAKREDMEQWIRQGRFLEYGEYKGNLYGTLAESVHAVIKQGIVNFCVFMMRLV